MPTSKTSYVNTLSRKQADALRELMEPQGWDFDALQYALWRARKDKTTVVAYESGKLVIQGKGTAELVQFTIEPHILGEARFGYEDVLSEVESPEMFEPHAGIDESGKGDYFGPLVIAAVFVDETTSRQLTSLGVTDSKKIKSDKRIAALAAEIRRTVGNAFSVVPIGPEAYNRLYDKIRNVNRLLAWGHARALENLLDNVPDCPRALSDQFGNKRTVENALMQMGRSVTLEQRTKAESDIAVAAASILARSEFVRRLDFLARDAGIALPKGASATVIDAAARIATQGGRAQLAKFAKMHFKTTASVLA